MIPDIAYLDWITGRPEQAEYDLGSSDLRRAPAGPGDVVPPALARDSPTAGLAEDDFSEDTHTEDAPTETPVKAHLAGVYGVEPKNVLLTAGATHANFLAIAATVSETESDAEPGIGDGADEVENRTRVLVEKPGYEPLIATSRGLDATVDRFRRPKAKGYPLDPNRITGALVEDTTLVTVTNRHNPSGRRVSRDELAEAASVVGNGGARLHVDEVYAPFDGDASKDPFDGDATNEFFGGPTAAGLPNTVVTNSLTKFFGFGGVRLGWLVADAKFVARARRVKHHVPAVAEPSKRLARRALARAPELAADSRERIRANHEMLTGLVAEREDLSGRVESGCTYAFLEHESAGGTEVAEAAWEQGVLVVPGGFFDDPDRFRIAACRKPETIRTGLDHFSGVLDSIGK